MRKKGVSSEARERNVRCRTSKASLKEIRDKQSSLRSSCPHLPLLDPLLVLDPIHSPSNRQASLNGVAELVGVVVRGWGVEQDLRQPLDGEGGGGEGTEETEEVTETGREY